MSLDKSLLSELNQGKGSSKTDQWENIDRWCQVYGDKGVAGGATAPPLGTNRKAPTSLHK